MSAERSEPEEVAEDQNQPGRLAGTWLMIRELWRILRGEDQRGRKLRWLRRPAAALPRAGSR